MIGEKLKRFRSEKGYTLVQLEEISGVSYVQIGRYENYKSVPTSKTLKKLAQALEVDVKEFLNESSSMEKIKDEDLDKKYKKIKNFFSEESDNRYALDKIFDLMILKGDMSEMLTKK